jgi:serine protease AprX
VLDRDGRGLTSSVLQALEFAIDHKDDLKIDIINLSLGHPIYESPETDPLVRAVEDAVRAGIVVVASAANYGINEETAKWVYAGITSPGNAPSAITIGAVDTQQTRIAATTPSPDTVHAVQVVLRPGQARPGRARQRLVAVGAYNGRLYADHPERHVNGNAGDRSGRYLRLSGTSMAAAVTSGVIA